MDIVSPPIPNTKAASLWQPVRHASEFKAALAHRPHLKSSHFAIHISHATAENGSMTANTAWQVGLIIPKRHHRQAVVRNTLKRIIRHTLTGLLRQHPDLHHLPAATYIIRLHRAWSFKQRQTTHQKKSHRATKQLTTLPIKAESLTSWRALKNDVRVEFTRLLEQLIHSRSSHAT